MYNFQVLRTKIQFNRHFVINNSERYVAAKYLYKFYSGCLLIIVCPVIMVSSVVLRMSLLF